MAVNTEPAWYQEWLKENDHLVGKPVLSTNPKQNTITLNAGSEEMLKISEDGFYIRGKKVPQDDKEAEQVYNCFKEWLTWSTMNRN